MFPGADRLMKNATIGVNLEWQGAQRKLGSRLERALLAEAVLCRLAIQDESVSDAKVRELLNEAFLRIMEVEW